MAIANVSLTNTFDYWRTVTNSLVVAMNDNLVYFGTANANTVSITSNSLRQGNVYVNVMTSTSVSDYAMANIGSAYSVNTVLNYTVAAFNYTNNAIVTINQNANLINSVANAAFNRTNAVSDQANAAFNQANAFSIVVSNTKPTAVQGSVWWHNALGKLFVYYKDGDTDQWIDTSPAYDVTQIEDIANQSFSAANNAANVAKYAANTSNATYDTSNLVFSQANAAFARANSASGATGGGSDLVFYLGDPVITTDYSIPTNKNALSAGPLELNSGATVTVNVGSTWTIV